MLLPLKRSREESEFITLTLRPAAIVDTMNKRRRLCDRVKSLFTDSKLLLNITAFFLKIAFYLYFIKHFF
ncbi:MAG TPA: hypothetical protein DDW76_09495 [Cyanobacteria bacterium UBA11369]|nr:hypothetical protein [Cyanobacteria bacterium UBA11371]HBE33981.1 hypothetical protein [Cyanobacteria bacterium UBA11368]HBE49011.1 hypothetical protein [Cyanobacteria bacterium UBA11369]